MDVNDDTFIKVNVQMRHCTSSSPSLPPSGSKHSLRPVGIRMETQIATNRTNDFYSNLLKLSQFSDKIRKYTVISLFFGHLVMLTFRINSHMM